MDVVLFGKRFSVAVEKSGDDLRIINNDFLAEASDAVGAKIIEAFIVEDDYGDERTIVMYSEICESCYGLVNDTYMFRLVD